VNLNDFLNSLINNTVKQVLESEFFKEYLQESFTNPDKVCYRCIQTCSVDKELQRTNDYKKYSFFDKN
jgi:hypothetical protein